MKQVTVLAPAKLNLTLDVTGLLPGGYHALDMLMQTITLHERVILRKSQGLLLRLPERQKHRHQGGAGVFSLHGPFGRGGYGST